MNFIPAEESSLFKKIFKIYTRWLFYRRFERVWIRQEYQPTDHSRTVYYLNHHSWWDGLIPFLLNEYRFHQQARAMMQKKQMQKYPFFKKIGGFSIDPVRPRSSIQTLRYAISSMRRKNASLFIYPQGEITPPSAPLEFKKGLAWLCQQLPDCDFVPVALYIHTLRSDKPELHIFVNNKIEVDRDNPLSSITLKFEKELNSSLKFLHETAGFEDHHFEKLL